MSDFDLIRASEIGEFVYCHRAWWLKRVEGIASRSVRQLERGTTFHESHERQVRTAGRLQTSALFLIIVGVMLLLLSQLIN